MGRSEDNGYGVAPMHTLTLAHPKERTRRDSPGAESLFGSIYLWTGMEQEEEDEVEVEEELVASNHVHDY